VPLNANTELILNSHKLNMMKSSAILINTARGGLVDEATLQKMLRNARLGGAAFDVFATEPPENYELLKLENFMVTPHIGGSSREAILEMGRAAIDGLDKHQVPDQTLFS